MGLINAWNLWLQNQPTVCIRVDSALATNTNTSASKQCLSIQSSKSGVTSIPGLPMKIHNIITFNLKFFNFISLGFFSGWHFKYVCVLINLLHTCLKRPRLLLEIYISVWATRFWSENSPSVLPCLELMLTAWYPAINQNKILTYIQKKLYIKKIQ